MIYSVLFELIGDLVANIDGLFCYISDILTYFKQFIIIRVLFTIINKLCIKVCYVDFLIN